MDTFLIFIVLSKFHDISMIYLLGFRSWQWAHQIKLRILLSPFFYQYLLVKKGNKFVIGPKFVKKICENKICSLIWWARYEMRIQTGIGSRYVLLKDKLKRRCLLSRNCPRVVSVVKLSKLGKKNCLPKRTESHPAKKVISQRSSQFCRLKTEKNCLVQPISVVLRCISVTTVHSGVFRTRVNWK